MPTHAELASELLCEAGHFFRGVAEDLPAGDERDRLRLNAGVYERMQQLVLEDPHGCIDGISHAALAGNLLIEAAGRLQSMGHQSDAESREQMDDYATTYQRIGALVSGDPDGRYSES